MYSSNDGFEHKMAYARRQCDVAARSDATQPVRAAKPLRHNWQRRLRDTRPTVGGAVTARRSAPVANGRLKVTAGNKSPGVVVGWWRLGERQALNKPPRLPLPHRHGYTNLTAMTRENDKGEKTPLFIPS